MLNIKGFCKPRVLRLVLRQLATHTNLRAVITVILKVKISNSPSSEGEIAKVWRDKDRRRRKNDYSEIWHFLAECTLALSDWLWVTLYDQPQPVWASVLSETQRGEKGSECVIMLLLFSSWITYSWKIIFDNIRRGQSKLGIFFPLLAVLFWVIYCAPDSHIGDTMACDLEGFLWL